MSENSMGGNLSQYSEQIDEAVNGELPAGEYSAIPPADYHLEVLASDIKVSKNGKRYVDAQFRVVGGRYDNRRIFEIFMLEGSERSVAISFSQLNSLATFNGKESLRDTSDIVGAHCIAAVKVEKGENGYADKNRASKFRPFKGEEPESVRTNDIQSYRDTPQGSPVSTVSGDDRADYF